MHQRLSAFLDVAERILTLIRPRFYNRLTWIVVGTGLLLTTTPWWGDLAYALTQKFLGVSLPEPTEHTFLGVSLVAIGLIYHVATHSIHELVASRRLAVDLGARGDHDRKLLAQLQALAPEQDLLGVLEDISREHHYWSSDGAKISRTIEFLRAPSNQFLDSDIASEAQELALTLAKLRNFMSYNFFEHMSPRNGDMRFCLFPDGNIDRSSDMPSPEQLHRYDKLSSELESHVCAAEEGYAKFRSIVKRRLAV